MNDQFDVVTIGEGIAGLCVGVMFEKNGMTDTDKKQMAEFENRVRNIIEKDGTLLLETPVRAVHIFGKNKIEIRILMTPLHQRIIPSHS